MDFDKLSSKITPDLVFDVGCFKGGWHNEARLRWPNAHFILVDANPANLEAMQATGAEHYIAVLSDREKEVTFYTRRDDQSGCTGDSCFKERTPWYDDPIETKVMATTLDDLISRRGRGPLPTGSVLIKIDAQGSELDILKGGDFALGMTSAVVLEVSLEEYNSGSPLFNEADAYMREAGFKLLCELGDITHPIHGHIIQRDVLYVR